MKGDLKIFTKEDSKILGIEICRAIRFLKIHLKTNSVKDSVMLTEQSYGEQVTHYMLTELNKRWN